MSGNYHFASVVVVLLASAWTFVASAAEQKPVDPAKVAAEAKQREDLRVRSVKAGWLKGVRTVELIRADILSVTLDSGITGAIAPTMYIADSDVSRHRAALEPYAKPDAFTITSLTDPDYKTPVRPADVGQCTYEGRNGVNAGKTLPSCTIFHTDCFLFLPKPMKSGHRYTVEVQPRGGRDAGLAHSAALEYDDAKTPTKGIKINQVAYSSLAKQRYAYLGWWAGNKGKVDYAALKRFEVIDEKTGKTALAGEVRLRAGDEMTVKVAGEEIYEMDIAALPVGRYHIRVPGLGCSDPLEVGGKGIQALYYHALRAFFHQRCGQEFKEPWTWVKKPACHSEIYESGYFAPETLCPGEKNQDPKRIPPPGPDAKPRHFRGGYHDAADFDVLAGHLSATSELITLYDLFPEAFADRDLDLPESGNRIPDILDEAEWCLLGFLELQYPNGAVPLGRGNMQDSLGQNIENGYHFWEWAKGKNVVPPYTILPPKDESTPAFAAVAASYSRVIRKFDAAKADRYLAAAQKAFAYASTHTPEQVWTEYSTDKVTIKKPKNWNDDGAWKGCCLWAAGELLRATGKKEYMDFIKANEKYMNRMNWRYAQQRVWAFINADAADPAMREKVRKDLMSSFGDVVKKTSETPYRMSYWPTDKGCGWWGSMQGIRTDMVLAYGMTKDQKFLDTLCLLADWHLGCNPRSQTSMTGMGYRYPRRPEISHFLYEQPLEDLGGKTVRGISLYGIGPELRDWFGPWPKHRSWRDVFDDGAEVYSEFTVPQTLAPAAATYATIYALEKKAGTIPPGSKPNPLER